MGQFAFRSSLAKGIAALSTGAGTCAPARPFAPRSRRPSSAMPPDTRLT
jgi:hypothetical protein